MLKVLWSVDNEGHLTGRWNVRPQRTENPVAEPGMPAPTRTYTTGSRSFRGIVQSPAYTADISITRE